MPDFRATDHGSTITLKPLTEGAEAWVAEHLPEEAPRWCGAVAIEPRYFKPIYDGAREDGLTFDFG